MNEMKPVELNAALKTRLIRISLVFVAVSIAAFLVTWFAWGQETAWVALASAAACGLGALLAHVCSELPRGDLFIMVRLMSSSMVRVGIPLLVLLVVKFQLPELFDRGMVYFVILFYVVGLLTDLKMQIGRFKPDTASSNQMLSATGGDSQV